MIIYSFFVKLIIVFYYICLFYEIKKMYNELRCLSLRIYIFWKNFIKLYFNLFIVNWLVYLYIGLF